ncbi:MAG: DUF3368 domain-containing protein [Geitlerinemataceae cyanobacterium]
MPKVDRIVINTSPLIALVAALETLTVLPSLYNEVLVPFEVCQEILCGGSSNFAVAEFAADTWLQKIKSPLIISPLLLNSLDRGEAAVIQLALDEGVSTVCIDETVGRRVARLSGLTLTGSVGILLRAKREGYPISVKQSIVKMLDKGIRLSPTVINFALKESGEDET